MGLNFEWDAAKARSDRRKHKVAFEEAATVFGDPRSLTIYDPDHSIVEEHFVTMGLSAAGRVLVVVHTDRGGCIRLISARKATQRERRAYEAKREDPSIG
jgi:uncharacterized DUF497 family protein